MAQKTSRCRADVRKQHVTFFVFTRRDVPELEVDF